MNKAVDISGTEGRRRNALSQDILLPSVKNFTFWFVTPCPLPGAFFLNFNS